MGWIAIKRCCVWREGIFYGYIPYTCGWWSEETSLFNLPSTERKILWKQHHRHHLQQQWNWETVFVWGENNFLFIPYSRTDLNLMHEELLFVLCLLTTGRPPQDQQGIFRSILGAISDESRETCSLLVMALLRIFLRNSDHRMLDWVWI